MHDVLLGVALGVPPFPSRGLLTGVGEPWSLLPQEGEA